MKHVQKYISFLLIIQLFLSCKQEANLAPADLTIAFGSCNKQYLKNELWDDIVALNPDAWIWGGDIVYTDSEDIDELRADYDQLLQDEGYKLLLGTTKILGTWDDHDYGMGDGGEHFNPKKESQQVFLDFFNVPQDDQRRNQEGVYYSETLKTENGSVKIILLDTRYFRSDLTESSDGVKRYQPNKYGEGTMLGEKQWEWLENELKTSNADFNIIMSSIQVWAFEHGFETWGNFPHEVDRLKQTILDSKANGVILLSGDRHISEFSEITIKGMAYPIIDFTSSGLTHVFENFPGEPNAYRHGKVIANKSFGILEFDFESKKVTMKMIGDGQEIFQQLTQQY